MTTEVVPDPDVEEGARQWARSLEIPNVVDADGAAAVYFGPPTTLPEVYITLYRVGGAPQRGEAPLRDVRITWNVYGLTKNNARAAAGWLVGHIEAVSEIPMAGSTYCYGATVDTAYWAPVPDSRHVRYVVDSTFTVRAG